MPIQVGKTMRWIGVSMDRVDPKNLAHLARYGLSLVRRRLCDLILFFLHRLPSPAMAKGEDSIARKKNKVIRKRMRKDHEPNDFSSSLPSKPKKRVASLIAAKKRRKSGKRRMCEGMCFSLPTPEDPFNDRYEMGITNSKKPKNEKIDSRIPFAKKDRGDFIGKKAADCKNGRGELLPSKVLANKQQDIVGEPGKTKVSLLEMGEGVPAQVHGNSDGLPKFLILCLSAIQNAWLHNGSLDGNLGRPLLANSWGVEFWRSCSGGLDILETSGSCASREQIAWLVSTAADIVTRKEREGLAIASPFLLFLVPSQEEAIQVRSLCKPLKPLGIHTVSLHPGASLDHQVHGLRSCEPEFLVSTPERLSELVSLGAIDISGASFLVVDGLENFINSGLVDKLKFITQCVSGDPQTIIFSNFYGKMSTSVAQNLLRRPIQRLSLNDSVTSQGACISQRVHMYRLDEEKMAKVPEILYEACSNRRQPFLPKVLIIVETASKAQLLVTSVQIEGCCLSSDTLSNQVQGGTADGANNSREKKVAVLVTDKEHVTRRKDIAEFEIIVFFDFPSSIDLYTGILTKMARHSVNGVLHSFFCVVDAPMASSLTKVLEQCAQPVPESVRDLCDSSATMVNF